MKIFSPELLTKWLTIPYINTTGCHSTKIFFLKGDASEKQIEPIWVAFGIFKVIKFLFFTTESFKSHEVRYLKYWTPHESGSLHLNQKKSSHCKSLATCLFAAILLS